jgi:hydroxymethylpyrimidine pyrophosphatase-like HAD family hydrolase
MQLTGFAFDYDGTIASHGRVDERTCNALKRLKAAEIKLLLVTGRELPDLQRIFENHEIFDAIVTENGALLSLPAQHEDRGLASPPPAALMAAIRKRNIEPLSIGHSIIATWEPNESKVLDAIRESGVEWQIIFNKGAVMALPPGVNKASGLRAALKALELSALDVMGVGDAENDQAMLTACGYSTAVANAIETIKEQADIVTQADHGAGVVELIENFLCGSLDRKLRGVRRHDLRLGSDGSFSAAIPREARVLICGASGAGKSRAATLFIERIREQNMQFCLVDPEGEYQQLEHLISVGDASNAPTVDETVKLLKQPCNNVLLNLLSIDRNARPAYLARLLAAIEALKMRTSRPHWLVLDEAHHGLVEGGDSPSLVAPRALPGSVFVTAAPFGFSRSVLQEFDVLIIVGNPAAEFLDRFSAIVGLELPRWDRGTLSHGEALYWERGSAEARRFLLDTPKQEHQRHIRKYAEGKLGEDKRFYFRGPENKLHLAAHNLNMFLELANGVDPATWLFHLERNDYSRWFLEAIKDEELAAEARRIEQQASSDPDVSRRAIRDLVQRRYTASGG